MVDPRVDEQKVNEYMETVRKDEELETKHLKELGFNVWSIAEMRVRYIMDLLPTLNSTTTLAQQLYPIWNVTERTVWNYISNAQFRHELIKPNLNRDERFALYRSSLYKLMQRAEETNNANAMLGAIRELRRINGDEEININNNSDTGEGFQFNINIK